MFSAATKSRLEDSMNSEENSKLMPTRSWSSASYLARRGVVHANQPFCNQFGGGEQILHGMYEIEDEGCDKIDVLGHSLRD